MKSLGSAGFFGSQIATLSWSDKATESETDASENETRDGPSDTTNTLKLKIVVYPGSASRQDNVEDFNKHIDYLCSPCSSFHDAQELQLASRFVKSPTPQSWIE